jgi:hypothetical protein
MAILRFILKAGSTHLKRHASISRESVIATFLVFLCAISPARADTYGDFTYTATNASVTITKYGGSETNVTIPDSILDEPVISIGTGAFQNGTNLVNVTIATNITNIGNSAFFGCRRLMNITIPGSVVVIGDEAFFNCISLTQLNLSNGVTRIGDLAFYNCSSLTNFTIPNSVTSMGADAFFGCSGLTSVTIPNSVSSIGIETFTYCAGLTNVTIPSSVTNIGDSAFESCIGLTNIIIPNSVTNVGDWAFSRCTGLKSTTIGNSVTRLGVWAFSYCSKLVSVYFEGDAPTSVSSGLFSSANQVTVYYRSGTTGWDATFAGRPTALWVPTYQEWAQAVGLLDRFPNASAESDDADHDGLNNLQEMLAATDPTNPNSVLKFETAPRPNDLADADKTPIGSGQHALYLQTVPGKNYEVQSVTAFDGTWQTETNVTATTTQRRVLVDKPAKQGFYRVVLVP